jgi:hypothetical protein
MRSRCNNPNFPSYKDYGGRGITVCAAWDDFAVFCADVGPRPEGMTLDRIAGARGYEPGNCRWASRQTQNEGRRNVVNVTIGGVTKCRSVWCREYGISLRTVRNRVARSGWTWEQAITTPVRSI